MSPFQTSKDFKTTLAPSSQNTLGTTEVPVAEKDIVDVEAEPIPSDAESGESSQDEKGNFVHWESDDDPRNPMNWSPARKWTTIGLISISSFNVYVSVHPSYRLTSSGC